MRSRSYQFLLIVLGLAALSGILFARLPFRLGLDIKGGSRLIYEVDKTKLEKNGPPLSKVMAQEQTILERRLGGAGGAAETVVQQKGEDQFIIEIPGVIDLEKARKEIGTTASLEVYHARNVVTDQQDKRPYRVEKKEGPNQTPVVTFYDQLKEKEVTPNDKEEYAKVIAGWDLILKGTDLKEAKVTQGNSGYQPSFEFSSEGARKLSAWCRKYKDDEENIAEVLDGVVLAIAPLKKGAILSDNAYIDGTFDPAYVRELVDLLNSGALPVKLNELSAQQVDPVVGTHALDMIVKAGAISFVVIAAFMVVYYVFPGIVAVVALILYTLFTLTVLKSLQATFSLASIAGFILSVGMAVDANILVFERVKEEMRAGKPLENAIDIGFKRALSAIVDSNTCTILTSLVLAYLGTGPVKGFATTLIIGVLISLFTAVTVTRSLLMFLVGSGLGANPNLYGLKRQWFGEAFEKEAHRKPLQIVNKCGRYFVISLITIVPGAIFWMNGGLKKNVEFQGGYQVELPVTQASITSNQIVSNLESAGLKGSNVQFMEGTGGQRLVSLTVPRVESLKNDPSPQTTIAKAAGFEGAEVKAFSSVGETIRAETVWNAVLGVIIAAALIVVYLAIRFGVAVGGFVTGLRFSLSAIGAMLHDILVVIGIAAIAGGLWGWEISALFITAVLTMIGFSTHDTIVIFDRIRENLRRPHPNEDFANLVNRSITQSFARSLNTSGTVVVTLIILIFAGSATMDLKFFNLAMLVGIISGTYSSIYNAAPILYLWDKAIVKRKGIQASLMTISEKEILHTRSTVSTVAMPKTDAAAEDKSKAYGQVKRRRASAVERSQKNIDDDV